MVCGKLLDDCLEQNPQDYSCLYPFLLFAILQESQKEKRPVKDHASWNCGMSAARISSEILKRKKVLLAC